MNANFGGRDIVLCRHFYRRKRALLLAREMDSVYGGGYSNPSIVNYRSLLFPPDTHLPLNGLFEQASQILANSHRDFDSR